ncbi:hypothetical protein POM88_044998 [Heracleum sosnowskyi]|uniref:Uncharacterized protein n=1 Tax=Heracleum sosnowskyi TaxID=360622 RepID=A0AAD8H6G0_9APIA|nr:hypothetical protein POM88_044998 [Heracleum sosnowskyi]
MSPRSMDPISPMGSRLTAFTQHEFQQPQQMRSLSSCDLSSNNVSMVGYPVNSWSKWSSPSGKVDWSVNGDEHSWLPRSSLNDPNKNTKEPDISWVQSLVKESPPEMKDKLPALVAMLHPVRD